ncbi:hypothetical protein E2562_032876 [Oryza meyeriana var. granulata]|uniref:Uncharacterized protein n=1 Tax=Oryza meyeriana var. granulata TaxID=110450 RepID=A0A6G1F0M7_9ORYZ|nr:hypothetical protein E2562_032876 [Oryza meyeriana var. granulata]
MTQQRIEEAAAVAGLGVDSVVLSPPVAVPFGGQLLAGKFLFPFPSHLPCPRVSVAGAPIRGVAAALDRGSQSVAACVG